MLEKNKGPDEMFCPSCAAIIKKEAVICVKCGVALTKGFPNGGSDKSCIAVFLLCTFFGVLGVHRFYVGKIGSGIFQLLTAGGFGIWTFIDWIMIMTGNFTDAEHQKITW